MIHTVRLSLGYGDKVIVRDVNISVRPGEFVSVIGPNAAGKTTLLKTLASLLKPIAGVVYIDGLAVANLRPRELASLIGVVLTDQVKLTMLTVAEVVALGRYPYTGLLGSLSQEDRREVLRALSDVGLEELADRRFCELSDGQRQKVMIARALAQEPRALILDEPVTHLDPKARVEVLMMIKRVCRERRIVVVASLHEVDLALRMADRLIIVSDGGVIAYDSPEEFIMDGGPTALFGLGECILFSPELATVEFRWPQDRDERIFVVAGGGSGSLVYRMLNRLGYSFSTGVLHRGDVDYIVAKSLGGVVIEEEAFQPISPRKMVQALEEARSCAAVIYTSPPIGPLNSENRKLAEAAAVEGRPLIVLGPRGIRGAWRVVDSFPELEQSLQLLREKAVAPTIPRGGSGRSINP
ncbi:MAG: ABC transporter ATP-binding protein [Nitrososphaerota archaeon]